jgi:arginase
MNNNKPTFMNNDKPILLYFPQWQGSGLTNEVQIGAQTLCNSFIDVTPVAVPLSDEPLTSINNIIAYKPLVTQLQSAKKVLDQNQPKRLLLVAGDCAAEIAPIEYLNKLYDSKLLVLWLDAHPDLNTPDSSPSAHFHGMPLRLLLDGQFPDTLISVDKPLDNSQVVFIGLRDADLPEEVYISENSLKVLKDKALWVQQLSQLIAEKERPNLYIHLDLDILDPKLFPQLRYPTANGNDPNEIAGLLNHLIKNYNVVGLSLTEATATEQDQLKPIQPILNEYKKWLHSSVSN